MKALSLLSGGLDSIVATRLMLQQGIEVEAVTFVSAFCTCTEKGRGCLAGKQAADTLGIKLKVFDVGPDYFTLIKKPKYGYGRNLNPCLDCRIFMFKRAACYMREIGAQFIITGEVLGERPMSQRKKAMKIIERDSGLEGLIVRPLSARLLSPSLPERVGIVNRKQLLNISGRSRKPQMQLAKDFGIYDYPCPAGGCLLTDSGFARKMRDLMEYKPGFTTHDVRLLRIGRHFRLGPTATLIVGRDEDENRRLSAIAQEEDIVFLPLRHKGPTAIGRGDLDKDFFAQAGAIVARYSDTEENEQHIPIIYKHASLGSSKTIEVNPISKDRLETVRI